VSDASSASYADPIACGDNCEHSDPETCSWLRDRAVFDDESESDDSSKHDDSSDPDQASH
jgi:hypothetical protein